MKKNIILFLFVAIILILPVASAQENIGTFTEEQRDNQLGFFSSIRFNANFFTIAGEERNCAEHPIDRDGDGKGDGYILLEGWCGDIGSYPNLINFYRIPKNGGDWLYMGEYEAPTNIACTYATDTNYYYGYEEYICDVIECINGDTTCFTDSTAKTCINGEWIVSETCSGGEVCSGGTCGSFGECLGSDGSCWSDKRGQYCFNNYYIIKLWCWRSMSRWKM